MFDVLAIIPHGNNVASLQKNASDFFKTSGISVFSFYPKIIPLMFFEPVQEKNIKKLLQQAKTIIQKPKIKLENLHLVQKDELNFFCVEIEPFKNLDFSCLSEFAEPAKSELFFENKMILGFSKAEITDLSKITANLESEVFDVFKIALFRFDTKDDSSLSFSYEVLDSVWGS